MRSRSLGLGALMMSAALFASSCKRPAATPPDTPWTIEVVNARAPEGMGDTGVVRCAADGEGCTALHAKDPLVPGSLFRVAQGGSATLSLDGSAVVSFAPDTEVLLGDGAERVVSLRHGAFALSFEPPASGTGTLPSVRFPGGTISLPSARAAALSIAVERLGAALVTVHHGLASLVAGGHPAVEVATGQTVRVSTDGVVDRRAGFRGEIAFAEVAGTASIEAADMARGLGTMTARVPGTDRVVGGVRLASHHVRAFIRDGFARTEIEETFQNDGDLVLEGRYVFPLPADASISRLGLWVGDKLVEGEMVESKKAAAIFKSIVDDTVRPRDPALLEWVKGSEFSLKVFPLPAHGSRRVVLAYNQVLSTTGGRVRYAYPLSLGKDRSVRIEDLAIQVRVENTALAPHDPVTPHYAPALETTGSDLTATYAARNVSPDADFVLAYREDEPDGALAAAYVPALGEFTGKDAPKAPPLAPNDGRYVALRLHADLPEDLAVPERRASDRAIILDVSQSQSPETVAATASLVKAVLKNMDPDERFAILACDGACASFPDKGLASAADTSFVEVIQWMQKLAPSGSSDVAGALIEAARRLPKSPDHARQIVYVGDGAATSGELKAETIATRARAAVEGIDLRLLGAGRTVDEVLLTGLAQALGGTYERVASGEPITERAAALSVALRSPVVVSPHVELPAGYSDAFPKSLPNLRLGQEVVVLARSTSTTPLSVRLTGTLAGQAFVATRGFAMPATAIAQNPLVPRLWAEARVRDLEGSTAKTAKDEVIDLSHRFHVMSRYTSLLVLESDKMFAELGIARTTHAASDQSDEGFGREVTGQGGGGGGGGLGALAAAARGGRAMGSGASPSSPAPPPAMAPAPAAAAAPMSPGAAGPRARPSAPAKKAAGLKADAFGGGGGYYVPRQPHGTVTRLDDAWRTAPAPEIDRLQQEVASAPTSRRKLEALVRAELNRGRVTDALPIARRFVELDPDLPVAIELLSFAAAVAGDSSLAVGTVDAMCEADSTSVRAHLRAAKAFEGAGSEIRACGHWRSLAELVPTNDDHRYEALRCRARAMAEPSVVLGEIRAMPTRSKRIDELAKQLEAGTLPTYATDKESEGAIEVTVTCADGAPADCPAPVLISPLGGVFSPWTPGDARTSARGVALSRISSGAYHVLLVGGAPSAHGDVNVRALDGHLKVAFTKGGTQTVALATIQL